MDSVEAGKSLAARQGEHAPAEPYDPALSLLNYAELAHEGDWTLRSALVRLAQPEPARVGSLLTLARRLDAPLHHVRRTLEREVVTSERAGQPYTDIRTADLARLLADGHDHDQLLAGYQQLLPLEKEELLAVPILAIAVSLERFADLLSAWALAGSQPPPLAELDQVVSHMSTELDRLAIPEESGYGPRGR